MSNFRESLAGMESLSGLSELKLEREEQEGRKAGVWKEYIKSDGRKWYYNNNMYILVNNICYFWIFKLTFYLFFIIYFNFDFNF